MNAGAGRLGGLKGEAGEKGASTMFLSDVGKPARFLWTIWKKGLTLAFYMYFSYEGYHRES